MDKTKVLDILSKFKDRPVEVRLDGDITFYGNMEGRWLLDGGNYIVAVTKNTQNGSYQLKGSTQNVKPFTITYASYNDVFNIRSYIGHEPGDIQSDVGSLTPLATSKTIGDIITELQTDSIHNAASPTGYLDTEDTKDGSDYGHFRGARVTTSIDGF